VSKQRVAAAFALGFGLVFLVSGLRYEPERYIRNSPAICGPLTDQCGNHAEDAGPCPSSTMPPNPNKGRWEWAPFWVPRQ
jgi:glycerol uptake facilitator-like aquaporin